ncbi:MAG: DUF488 domain-containing protein [bacterium]|nr:DUF488 domain-containing protein [bacterium]
MPGDVDQVLHGQAETVERPAARRRDGEALDEGVGGRFHARALRHRPAARERRRAAFRFADVRERAPREAVPRLPARSVRQRALQAASHAPSDRRRAHLPAHASATLADVVVHTIGHSTRALDDFLALLAAHGIRAVADVRRHPGSRRHPHFARDALATSLAERGFGYDWMPELGGRRRAQPDSPHRAWREESFRAYADHMDGTEFRDALATLLANAERRSTAIMCAEAVPWRCHRRLIADALLARGVEVRHVVGPGTPKIHTLTRHARLDGERVVYDAGQPDLPALGR